MSTKKPFFLPCKTWSSRRTCVYECFNQTARSIQNKLYTYFQLTLYVASNVNQWLERKEVPRNTRTQGVFLREKLCYFGDWLVVSEAPIQQTMALHYRTPEGRSFQDFLSVRLLHAPAPARAIVQGQVRTLTAGCSGRTRVDRVAK